MYNIPDTASLRSRAAKNQSIIVCLHSNALTSESRDLLNEHISKHSEMSNLCQAELYTARRRYA